MIWSWQGGCFSWPQVWVGAGLWLVHYPSSLLWLVSKQRSSCWHHLTPHLLPNIMTPPPSLQNVLRSQLWSRCGRMMRLSARIFLTCQIFLSISKINWIHWLARIFFILIYHIKTPSVWEANLSIINPIMWWLKLQVPSRLSFQRIENIEDIGRWCRDHINAKGIL